MSRLATSLAALELTDPLMIASSHWTAQESVYDQLAPFAPVAATLKTISADQGDGTGKSRRRILFQGDGSEFARFTDGPKHIELWTIGDAIEKTRLARERLPNTQLGVSVREGEDYSSIAGRLDLGSYRYAELNLKYTLRDKQLRDAEEAFQSLATEVESFASAFSELVAFVKLPREIAPFLRDSYLRPVVDAADAADVVFVVANSLRARRVANSRYDSEEELANGVLVGEHLLMQTVEMIDATREFGRPIVASGGVLDLAGIIDVVAAGADAVQLCTALDRNGVGAIDYLRDQFHELLDKLDYRNFSEFRDAVRASTEQRARALAEAKSYRLNERAIDRFFLHQSSEPRVRALMVQGLRVELAGVSAETEHTSDNLGGKELAFTRGNVSALALGSHIAHAAGLLPRVSYFSRDLLRDLEQVGADERPAFVILPEGAGPRMEPLEYVPVGEVAYSVVQLVGTHLNPTRVLRFAGSSFDQAASQLTDESVTIETIERKRLYPTLKYWRPDQALLAKPPLAQLYGTVGEQENWQVLQEWKHPIVLWKLSSIGDEGRALRFLIQASRQEFVDDDRVAYAQLVTTGFLGYCRELIGGTK